jgi:AcrR family transcriptional regulator
MTIRGRRITRAEQRERTRAAIVGQAGRLFLRRGIDGTSLDAVAAALGLTKGAVYAHFPSKAALIGAVAELGKDTASLLDVLLRADLPLVVRLGRLGRALATSGPSRDLVLLDLEYVIYRARHPRRGRRSRARFREELADLTDRFRAANAVRGERPPLDETLLLYLINILARGVIQELTVDPKALAAADVEGMFALLAGTWSATSRRPTHPGTAPSRPRPAAPASPAAAIRRVPLRAARRDEPGLT